MDQYDAARTEYAQQIVSDRSSVVGEINSEVARLKNVVDRAEERLSSILEPEFLGSDNKTTSEPAPIRSFIRQTHLELSRQIDRLIVILDRVEA